MKIIVGDVVIKMENKDYIFVESLIFISRKNKTIEMIAPRIFI